MEKGDYMDLSIRRDWLKRKAGKRGNKRDEERKRGLMKKCKEYINVGLGL